MPSSQPPGPGRSTRSTMVVALLFGSLMLALLLAWQAYASARSHLAVVETVLREYAMLVAEEFGRRTISHVGFRGYFRLITIVENAVTDGDNLPMVASYDTPDDRQALDLARGYFVYEIESDRLDIRGLDPTTALRQRLRALGRGPAGNDEPFGAAFYEDTGRTHLIVYAQREGQPLRGVEIDFAALQPWLAEVFAQGPLLPASLADGQLSNELLFLSISDPNGVNRFLSGDRYDSKLRIEHALGSDYQGIFKGFTITASVNPSAAASLIIGGLPQSRLPWLAAILLMTIGLSGAAIWLLRREEAVLKMRSDFISRVSHELRTPLTQIRMFVETLLLRRVRNEAEQKRYLEIIDRESQRLMELVENILIFSKRTNGARRLRRRESLSTLVRETCENFATGGEQTERFRLDLDDSIHACVDRDAIRQILLNLLDNAVKYGPIGEDIAVVLRQTETEALLSVCDRGPGIPEAESDLIWDSFYRLKRDNGVSGTGIGLAVVKELATEHGGRCRAQVREGGGTCFELALPLATAEI